LAKVREEKAGHQAAVKELERSAKDLQGLIARLQSEEERQRRASRAAPKREPSRGDSAKEDTLDLRDDGRFERLRGKLPWPAKGTLASGFGRQEHPRFHTVTFNRGIEIAAPQGRDIVAVAEGTAIYADWFKGYGRLVILDHGGGYFTLYAHCADILVKTGDAVPGGQVIAKVGTADRWKGHNCISNCATKGNPRTRWPGCSPANRAGARTSRRSSASRRTAPGMSDSSRGHSIQNGGTVHASRA